MFCFPIVITWFFDIHNNKQQAHLAYFLPFLPAALAGGGAAGWAPGNDGSASAGRPPNDDDDDDASRPSITSCRNDACCRFVGR